MVVFKASCMKVLSGNQKEAPCLPGEINQASCWNVNGTKSWDFGCNKMVVFAVLEVLIGSCESRARKE